MFFTVAEVRGKRVLGLVVKVPRAEEANDPSADESSISDSTMPYGLTTRLDKIGDCAI